MRAVQKTYERAGSRGPPDDQVTPAAYGWPHLSW